MVLLLLGVVGMVIVEEGDDNDTFSIYIYIFGTNQRLDVGVCLVGFIRTTTTTTQPLREKQIPVLSLVESTAVVPVR